MMSNLQPNTALRAVDFLVQRELKSPGAPPIIGLVELQDSDTALRALIAYLSGDSHKLRDAFKAYPYATAWAIATILRRSYGAEENHAVYEPIATKLRIPLPVNGAGRSMLREGFDVLCRRLGISTVDYDRHVDIYLAQAGVPEGMLDHLATAFLRQERYFGPPPLENSRDLNQWENDALELLPPTVRTPRLPVELDETGWHAALYADIRSGPEGPNRRFATAFRRAIEEQSEKVSLRTGAEILPRPRLVWDDGCLGLSVPRLEGRLKFWPEPQSPMLRLRGGETWRLPPPWPKEMRWQAGEHGGEVTFLRDPTAVVIFDRQTGRFLREVAPRGQSESLDAVEIVLLCRRKFAVDGKAGHMLDEDAHIAMLDLENRPYLIATDDGELVVRLRPRRRITALGGMVATGPNGTLHGPGTQFRIETGQNVAEERFLRVSAADREAKIPLSFAATGMVLLGIEDVIAKLDAAGPTPLTDPLRLRMELPGPLESGTASGLGGSIASTFWVWPGVMPVPPGFLFEARQPPANLVLDHCRHILRNDSGQVCLDRLGGYAKARLAFDMDGIVAAFDIPFPDVTCVRRSADGREYFLPFGTQIVLREEDRFDTITIRCPDPKADLVVRGKIERSPFREGRPRNIALRDLISATKDDRISVRKENGTDIELFRVVQALSPTRFNIRSHQTSLLLTIEMRDRIDAFRLNIEDELGGWFHHEIAIGHRLVDSRPPDWLTGDVSPDNYFVSWLRIDTKKFPPGMHLAQVLVRPTGEDSWKRLGNLRGDTFALAIVGGGALSPEDLERRFQTLTRWMIRCYAPESWEHVKSIVPPRWRDIGSCLFTSPEGRSSILAAATISPTEDTSSSWVPIDHPLTFLPEMYSVSSEHFSVLAACEDEGAAALSIVSEVSSGRLREKDALDFVVLLGFANATEADRTGKPLTNFDPRRFLSYFEHSHIDKDPAAGWFWRGKPLLGPGHWRAAHLRFRERLEAAGLFAEQDADEHTPNGLRQLSLQRLMSIILKHADIVPPVPKREATDTEPGMVDRWAATALCSFAKEARSCGVKEWAARMAEALGCTSVDVLRDIAFLLRLAPELFAFYMGMWQLAFR